MKVGVNPAVPGQAAPAPSKLVVKLALGVALVPPELGVIVAFTVWAPQVDGFVSIARLPVVKAIVMFVNPRSGMFGKSAVTWPVPVSTAPVPR